MKIIDFEEGKNKVTLTYGSGPMNIKTMNTDVLVILEDFEEDNEKQISFYRTIVDGMIPHDEKL